MAQKPNNELDQILNELNESLQKEKKQDSAAAKEESLESAVLVQPEAANEETTSAPVEESKPAEKKKAAPSTRRTKNAKEPVSEGTAVKKEDAASIPAEEKKKAPATRSASGAKKPAAKKTTAKSKEEAAAAEGAEEKRRTRKKPAAAEKKASKATKEAPQESAENVGRIEVKSVEVVENTAAPQQDPLTAPIVNSKRRKMSKRDRMTAVLGAVISFFVIIGVITSVSWIVRFSSELINSTAQKTEFERYIFPLVIIDVPEFDTPEALDNSQIIASAIWAFIIDEDNDKAQYPHDDLGGMTVPEADIELYIRRLYGNELPIRHQTVDGASFQMLYDEAGKSYIIETTPRFLPYTPQVESISRTADGFILRVNYVQPDAVWNLDTEHRNRTVDKVMEYTLKFTEESYMIQSVKLLEVTGTEVGSSSSDSQYGMIESEAENVISDLPPEPGTVSEESVPTESEETATSAEEE